jgi:hypothetical protein
VWAIATSAAAGPIATNSFHYRDGATSVTRVAALILWSYVLYSLGFVALGVWCQWKAGRVGAIGLLALAWLDTGLFVALRPHVAPHTSSDGLFVFGAVFGLVVLVICTLMALANRILDYVNLNDGV